MKRERALRRSSGALHRILHHGRCMADDASDLALSMVTVVVWLRVLLYLLGVNLSP